jgi:hypothetical protein
MSAPEKVVEKLRKLMALAKGAGASEGEVDNALRFARKLMDDYGIAEDSILLTEDVNTASRRIIEDTALKLGHIHHHDINLAMATKYICDVDLYLKGKREIVFFGMERDVAVAKALFSELRVIMRTMARFTVGESDGPSHKSFLIGFSSRIHVRAKELKKKAAAPESTGTAIILAKDAARERYKEGLGLVKSRKSNQSIRDWKAYTDGNAAAENVSLGTNGIGEGRARKRLG